MKVEWIETIICEKRRRGTPAYARREREEREWNLVHAQIGQLWKRLSKSLMSAITLYNSKVEPQHRVEHYACLPDYQFEAHKSSYPAAYLYINFDEGRQAVRCSYRYIAAEGERAFTESREIGIRIERDNLYLVSSDRHLSDEDLAKAILGDFMRRL